MRLAHAILPFLLLSAQALTAETTADRLETVARDLDRIVADLETAQAQTTELRARLTDLETQSATHQATLSDQDRLLAEYRASVAALESHDKASLALALNLKGQLQTERAITGWLWPLVGVSVSVALVEGFLLGSRR